MGPLSDDFTIAKLFDSTDRISRLESAITTLGSETVVVTRRDIDAHFPADEPLTALEAEAAFTGLALNEAAEKVGHDTPFVDARFSMDVPRVRRILREQAAAAEALKTVSDTTGRDTDVEVVATIPPQLDIDFPLSVTRLDTTVRSAMLKATDVVRIANPYFDPGHPTVETLQSLPGRGVETRVLTRAVEPGTDRHAVLTAMWESLSKSERSLLDVVELYEADQRGNQKYSTHAKVVVADRERCYLGSANFTATNLSTNFEIGFVTSGSEVGVVADTFDSVFDTGRRVSLGL